MLSIQHNFLFIHFPKTGDNSIQSVLKNYSEDRIVCLNDLHDGTERFEIRNKYSSIHRHSSLMEYQSELKPVLFRKAYKFTTIRNPWERAISFYFSPHRRTTVCNRDNFINLIETIKPLKEILTLPNQSDTFWNNVNRVIRFKNLSSDFSLVCNDINLPAPNLPIRNKSILGFDSYRKFYDSELIEIVRDKFSDAIDFGNYSFF